MWEVGDYTEALHEVPVSLFQFLAVAAIFEKERSGSIFGFCFTGHCL